VAIKADFSASSFAHLESELTFAEAKKEQINRAVIKNKLRIS
jgi:hypothetical protein